MGNLQYTLKSGSDGSMKLASATQALQFMAECMNKNDPIIFFAWRTAPDNLIIGGIYGGMKE